VEHRLGRAALAGCANAVSPAARAAPSSAQRARSSGPICFVRRICSGVCAWVHTISASATCFRRQPVAMRSIWRAALRPSLPAQIIVAKGRPLRRSRAA